MARQQQFALDYIDVASRIVEFRTKHPEGSLQQVALDFREVNKGWWCIFTAAAYRHPEDPRPGMGTAWEPIPGRTNFTRDSEVQNAETAAWGRAIVAAMAADTKKGVASAEEVRNRSAERDAPVPEPGQGPSRRDVLRKQVMDAANAIGLGDVAAVRDDYAGWSQGSAIADADDDTLAKYRDHLIARGGETA